MPPALTSRSIADAAAELARRDRGLARLHHAHGSPPVWGRRPGFATLVRIILEQQVSLASAAAIWGRLKEEFGTPDPETVIEVGCLGLRARGLTRQKATYFVNVAEAVSSGSLDLRAVSRAEDSAAAKLLTAVKGIGPWSAEVYLLMALRRPDVWPAGDVALGTAVQRLRGLAQRPGPPELVRIAEGWRPYRATAARMLWQAYLADSASGWGWHDSRS